MRIAKEFSSVFPEHLIIKFNKCNQIWRKHARRERGCGGWGERGGVASAASRSVGNGGVVMAGIERLQ